MNISAPPPYLRGDMVDGRYAEVESRYLDGEGKVKKYRDERSDRKCIAIG